MTLAAGTFTRATYSHTGAPRQRLRAKRGDGTAKASHNFKYDEQPHNAPPCAHERTSTRAGSERHQILGR